MAENKTTPEREDGGQDLMAARQALLDGMPDAVWMKDLQGRYLIVNRAFAAQRGLLSDEVIGKTEFEVWPLDMARRFVEEDHRVTETGRPQRAEVLLRDAGGRERWYDNMRVPIFDDHGNIIGAGGHSRDITDRKNAEHALQAAQARAQEYLAIAAVMILALDREGRVTLINSRGCQVLGRPETEVLGRDWYADFFPADLSAAGRQQFGQVMAGRSQLELDLEAPIVAADGTQRVILWHNALLRDAGGKISGLLSSGEDITDRQQAVFALRISENKFQDYFRLNPIPTAITATGALQILEVNAAFETLFRARGAELRGVALEDSGLLAQADDVARFRREISLQGRLRLQECGLKTRAGDYVTGLVSAEPVNSADRPQFMWMILDVTERKRAEGALSQAQQAAEIKAAQLTDLVHELQLINQLSVDRELRMVELKRAINALLRQQGQEPLYDVE